MATWKDVQRIVSALPEVEEGVCFGTAAWRVGKKLFAWERPLRPGDLKALGPRAPRGAILGVRVESLAAKEACLAARASTCFTIPHFDGYPAVLIRLGKIGVRDLENLIVEAWLARAPKKLAREYQAVASR